MAEGIQIRQAEPDDVDRGLLGVQEAIAQVGDVSENLARQRVTEIANNRDHHLIVAEEVGEVIACGTALVERKLIHSLGKVAHIEDIATAERHRGKGIGSKIVQALIEEAKKDGCYKAILDCSEANAKFYERLGFMRKELQMAMYF